MTVELKIRGLKVARQVEVDVLYNGHVIKGQRLDMLVEDEVVAELKAIANLPDVVFSQVMSYLKATGLKRGLIINFGKAKLVDGIKRVSRLDAQTTSEPSVTSVAK